LNKDEALAPQFRLQNDEVLRVADTQRLKRHRVQDAEYGRGGSDPESQ
jgi:hypothetical protein